jgi:AraC family transcriptional activator of pobA
MLHTLVDPRNGHLSFKLFSFTDSSHFDHLQRNNYYSLIWLRQGAGSVKADFAEYQFSQDSLFALSPYQPFLLQADGDVAGVALQFHPDFFCIHRHQAEVACNGVLFNNIYRPPFVAVDEAAASAFSLLIGQISEEMAQPALAQAELLTAYLKVFLITAARLKSREARPDEKEEDLPAAPFILQKLKDAIERDFRTRHAPADYARELNISTAALARITRAHFGKTLTDLIAERIIIEAKRELYLTNKAVKQIAWELGYSDEFYFSRFFKTNAAVSPQGFRETVGMGRAEAAVN